MRFHTAFSLLFAISTSTALFACGEQLPDAIAAHRAGKGTAEIYAANFEETWRATHAALRWNSAGTPEDHVGEGYVITNNPTSRGPSLGDQVGVWLETMGPDKTRVSVVIMTMAPQDPALGAPNEHGVQKDIAKALAMLESGQPLPEKRP